MTSNISYWTSGQALIEWLHAHKRRPNALALQEHRKVGSEALAQAETWSKARGYRLRFNNAVKTGEHALATSAGVAVGTWVDVAATKPEPRELKGHEGRLTTLHVAAVLRGGIEFICGYQECWKGGSCELICESMERLVHLGKYLKTLRRPWIIAMDWQREPEHLEQSGWPGKVGGVIVAPPRRTCTSGVGRRLDYFVVHRALVPYVAGVDVWEEAPTAPHHPVVLRLRRTADETGEIRIDTLATVRPFPSRPQIGCDRAHVEPQWSWSPGEAPNIVDSAWKEFIGLAEAKLGEKHDLFGRVAAPDVGPLVKQ